MIRTSDKYLAIFRIQLLNAIAYPTDTLASSASIVIFMLVFTQLWKVTFAAVGSPEIEGLTLYETLWYLMIAEAVLISKPRVSGAISQSVKDGSIAYILNKPYHFLLYHASMNLGTGVFQLGLTLIAGGLVIWLVAGPPPGPGGWIPVLVTIWLAWGIDYCIQAMIGLLGFLTEDTEAFDWIYAKFVLILGGVLLPLDFFPDWLQRITLALPFAYTTYGPAKLFIDPGWSNTLKLLIGQTLWLAGLVLTLILFYRWAIRRLSINGG